MQWKFTNKILNSYSGLSSNKSQVSSIRDGMAQALKQIHSNTAPVLTKSTL